MNLNIYFYLCYLLNYIIELIKVGINFEIYFNLYSLSNNITKLDLSNKDITKLPDLSRFKSLQLFDCSHNKLANLPKLPHEENQRFSLVAQQSC
jgi:Leucine-rich repeat (LRR) protein